jgi:hypothetical protein
MNKFLIIIIATILCVSCTSTVLVNSNSDPGVSFSTYKTYNWDNPLNKAADKSYNPLVNNSLVNNQIKESIREQLDVRSYVLNEKNPDLLINFHTMVENRSEITSYPNNYYFWWRNDIHSVNYKEGTLIIDLIDAESDQLVWQGYATGTLDRKDIALTSDEAVQMIFEKYPYRAGSGQEITAQRDR